VIPGGLEKMSKSKNNGIDPQVLIERYGADTVRLYTMFTSPPDQSLEWNDDGVEGAARFLKRLWNLAWRYRASRDGSLDGGGLSDGSGFGGVTAYGDGFSDGSGSGAGSAYGAGSEDGSGFGDQGAFLTDCRREVHAALMKGLYDYERHQFNTVVSACMTMVNVLYRLNAGGPGEGALLGEGLGIVLRLLAPIAPHVSHHLWRELGLGDDILAGGWPAVDLDALRQDQIEYVVQVNGKVRGKVQVPADAGQEAVEAAALANENVRRFIGEGAVRKVVVVPNKLVNLVVAR
jgi:leucyl-tRNA synthetase